MRSFLKKSALLVLLYIPAQYLFHKFTNDALEVTPFMKKVINGADKFAKADIVTFGSSVEYMSHPAEKDKRSMTESLERLLPQKEIIAFSQPAFTIKLLGPFIKFYNRYVNSDQLYVIELNMDQFSLTNNKRFLDRTPEMLSFAENLHSAMYKPLAIFNYDYGVLTQEEFAKQKIYLQGEYQGEYDVLYNTKPKSLSDLYRNRYMIKYLYQLDKSHEKIMALERLIEFVKKKQIKVLFYIVPFDYLSCEKYFDQAICSEVLGSNIKVLTDILDNSGLDYLNLTLDLPTEFIATTPLAPNGHLRSEGRKYNAKKISEWVKTNLN